MKVTFLIGNGFDLNLGLRTTYKSFYENYIEMLESESKNANVLYKNISENIENWVDFETRLGLFTFPENSMEKRNLIKQAKQFSTENEHIEDEVDVEVGNGELELALAQFRKDFKQYLVKESKKLNKHTYLLGDVLTNGMVDFAKDYNGNEKMGIYSNMISHVENSPQKGVYLPIDYSFLTFNYTNFLELGVKNINRNRLIEQLSRSFTDENYNSFDIKVNLGQVYNVHSKLMEGMFLGVDNDTQLHSERFSKRQLTSLIKPLSNEQYNNHITNRANKEIMSSDIIVIYGTALGITDSTWWGKVISFLKNRESNIVLIHKFDLTIDTEDDDFYNLAYKKEDIKDHLLSFDTTLSLDEITKLKKKIYINLNSPSIFSSKYFIESINSKYEEPSFRN